MVEILFDEYCHCTHWRQTPKINGVHICVDCQKPLYDSSLKSDHTPFQSIEEAEQLLKETNKTV